MIGWWCSSWSRRIGVVGVRVGGVGKAGSILEEEKKLELGFMVIVWRFSGGCSKLTHPLLLFFFLFSYVTSFV